MPLVQCTRLPLSATEIAMDESKRIVVSGTSQDLLFTVQDIKRNRYIKDSDTLIKTQNVGC